MKKVFIPVLCLSAQIISIQALAAISCSFNGNTVRIEHTAKHLAAGYVYNSGAVMGDVHASVDPRTGIYRYGFKINECREQACAFAYADGSFAGTMFGLGLPVCSGYLTITEIFYNPKSPESSKVAITEASYNRSLGFIKTDNMTGETKKYPAICSWVK